MFGDCIISISCFVFGDDNVSGFSYGDRFASKFRLCSVIVMSSGSVGNGTKKGLSLSIQLTIKLVIDAISRGESTIHAAFFVRFFSFIHSIIIVSRGEGFLSMSQKSSLDSVLHLT